MLTKTHVSDATKARFWSRVVVKVGGCWLWTGSKDRDGYGALIVRNRYWVASRFSYFLHFGEIPDGVSVCHTCDNPSCVNPGHLFLGTQRQNMLDARNKGREGKLWKRGETNHCAKLTEKKARKLLALRRQGISAVVAAKQFAISPAQVRKIWAGQKWKHLQPVES